MGCQDQNARALNKARHTLLGLFSEDVVAGCEPLIEDKDIGIKSGRDGET